MNIRPSNPHTNVDERHGPAALAAERERTLGSEHPETLSALHDLAVHHGAAGDLASAQAMLIRALEARERVLGPDHLDTLASLDSLASVYMARGGYSTAELLYRQLLDSSERIHGEDHPDSQACRAHLADVLDAMEWTEEAHAIRVLRTPPITQRKPTCNDALDLNNRAIDLRNQGHPAEAEPLLREALAIEVSVRGRTHPKIAHRLNNLATSLIMLDRLDEAREMTERAWAIKQGTGHDITSPRVLLVRLTVALLTQQPGGQFIGQLKTLAAEPRLPDYADVIDIWVIGCFFDYIGSKLPAGSTKFLQAIVAAFNHRKALAALNQFEVWTSNAEIGLETAWP